MGGDSNGNLYEEIRKKRVQANLKHLEELGISKLSKGLLEAAQKENESQRRYTKSKEKKFFEDCELRRSTRARNTAVTYTDQFIDPEPRHHRIRRSTNYNISAEKEYTGRVPSYKQITSAGKRAEIFQSDLNHPSFLKTMVRSHVSSCFWLGLPSSFCQHHLPQSELRMILEDEDGVEFDVVYIGQRAGLSGGWRGYALEHKLEIGDSLIFELTESVRFKVYVFRAFEESAELQTIEDVTNEDDMPISGTETRKGRTSKRKRKC